jgi:hypothetical protein
VGKLVAMLESSGREFLYGRMIYGDFAQGPNADLVPENGADARLLLMPHFLKRTEYQNEKEVRFVTAAAKRPEQKGILLGKTEPEKWIQAIRLWPDLKPTEETCLCAAVRRILPTTDCARSELLTDPDRLSAWIKKNKGQTDGLADAEWISGKDGIPSPLKKL